MIKLEKHPILDQIIDDPKNSFRKYDCYRNIWLLFWKKTWWPIMTLVDYINTYHCEIWYIWIVPIHSWNFKHIPHIFKNWFAWIVIGRRWDYVILYDWIERWQEVHKDNIIWYIDYEWMKNLWFNIKYNVYKKWEKKERTYWLFETLYNNYVVQQWIKSDDSITIEKWYEKFWDMVFYCELRILEKMKKYWIDIFKSDEDLIPKNLKRWVEMNEENIKNI